MKARTMKGTIFIRLQDEFSILWTALRRNKVALMGFFIVSGIVLMALLAPIIPIVSPSKMHWGEEYSFPSTKFWLGTDGLGRDIFSQIVWGARTSLIVGLFSTAVTMTIGIILGLIPGYYGGKIDNVIMSINDVLLSIPILFLLIAIAAIFEVRSLIVIIVIVGFIQFPRIARLVRSQVLSVKEQTYVEASRSVGAGNFRIILYHILPNSLSPIIIAGTLNVARAILLEAALSFLGLGDPTVISWGQILAGGRAVLLSAWWIATFPGLMIFLLILGLNLVGDGIRDALDVRLSKEYN